MTTQRRFASIAIPLVISFAAGLALTSSCGGGGGGGGTSAASGGTTGTVAVSLSDPPTCKAPNGDFQHVWVTVTKVRAHISQFADNGGTEGGGFSAADSGANDDDHGADGKWFTLVDLTDNPMQIDLLSGADTTCILTQLGATNGIPAGKYQQIRFHLLENNPNGSAHTPAVNNCQGVGGFNCIDTTSGGLQLLIANTNGNKGFKIPPGQIAGGGLHLAKGENADINIDFDACKSIVKEGNGTYRLKPTLHAGEVEVNKGIVTGRIVDSATAQPIVGGHFVVMAEQPDATGVRRVVAQKTVDAASVTFGLCPLPIGTYTFVIAGEDASGATYGPTVIFDVPTGTQLGDIPLMKVPGAITEPARVDGIVSTSAGASGATGADVEISLLQLAKPAGLQPVLVTVPTMAGSSSLIATQDGLTCAVNTKCAPYTIFVAASNPTTATFSVSGFAYTFPVPTDVHVSISGQAFVPGSPIQDCVPSSLIVSDDSLADPLLVTPGGMKIAGSMPFTGCAGGF